MFKGEDLDLVAGEEFRRERKWPWSKTGGGRTPGREGDIGHPTLVEVPCRH